MLEGVAYSGPCTSSMPSVRRTTLVRMVAVTFWREAGHGGALSSLYGVWDLSAPGGERGRTPEEETHPVEEEGTETVDLRGPGLLFCCLSCIPPVRRQATDLCSVRGYRTDRDRGQGNTGTSPQLMNAAGATVWVTAPLDRRARGNRILPPPLSSPSGLCFRTRPVPPRRSPLEIRGRARRFL